MSDTTTRRGSSGKDVDAEIEALHAVETVEVELPTVGRIVQLRIDTGGEDDVVILRPAVVVTAREDGTCFLRVFLVAYDIPLPPGAGIRADAGGYFAAARFGPECGEWRWPERLEEPVFFGAQTT